jgi:galactonate dehydratase
MSRVIEGVREMAGAARDAVGLDVDLIFELHRKLRATDAVAVAEALADFRPLFIEDPIQIDSIPIQADLARRFTFPLANGERLNTIWEFRDLFAAGGPQHVRPDVGNAGGLTGARKIAVLAEAHHSALVTHNYLGPLLTAASVHLDVAIPNFLTQEYQLGDESGSAGDAIFVSSLTREGGYMLAPEDPGIGVALDETRLAEAPPKYLRPVLPLREDGSPSMAI